MNYEDINIRISEYFGEAIFTTKCDYCDGTGFIEEIFHNKKCPKCIGESVPPRYIGRNYFKDGNAIREVIKRLNNAQKFMFVYELNAILDLEPINSESSIGEYLLFEFCSASPDQLTEACFKIINTTGEKK